MKNFDDISAYPLDWPNQYERTDEHDQVRWPGNLKGKTGGDIRDDLVQEAEKTADDEVSIVISSNLETFERGGRQVPYANNRRPDDPGIAVYLTIDGAPKVFACDRYRKVQGNMRAVTTTLRDLRRISKRGVNEAERAYQGFAQLPSKGETEGSAWWQILGIDPDTDTLEDVLHAYRERAKEVHPDQGGSQEAFTELQKAYEQANDYYADQMDVEGAERR